jgi:membrane protein
MQKALRFCYDLGRHGYRQLQHDRAAQMAGALAFRALFALLPVLVVATVLVRALGGFDRFKERIAQFFTGLELDKYTLHPADALTSQTLSEWLLELVDQVEQINLAAIGWVGLAVVVYAAIQLMVNIEKSFNIIYRAPEGRSWPRRLAIYWTVLTLGPVAIVLAMYIGGQLEGMFAAGTGWLSLFKGAPVIWSYVATWLVIFALYKLIPNTNVSLRPALVGALVAAIGTELGKGALSWYFSKAVLVGQLYGSLGLIPVFMFWIYVMWWVLLFGLEVSATLQMLGGRRLEEIRAREVTDLVDPACVLMVMEVVAERFEASRASTARHVADETSLPEATIARMFEHLTHAGFLHRLDQEDKAVTLAVPPDQVSADQLIEIGFRMVDEGIAEKRPPLLERLREAQRGLAKQVTLAALAKK